MLNQITKNLSLLLCGFALINNSYSTPKGKTVLLKQKRAKTQKQATPQRSLAKFESWALDSSIAANIKVDTKAKALADKREVVVAVIDTGIDPNHPYLKNNILKPNKMIANGYGVSFASRDKLYNPKDQHGHGTHVSGIIKSVFPSVKLLALKYYDPKASGQANLEATIKALEYAVDQNVDIINYSGGGPESSARELSILRKAEKKGILIIAAAGNERSNIDKARNAYYPASYGLSNIISVSAVDHRIKKVASSNWGANSVDLFAPGYNIKSAYPNARASVMTGTSQATAFVSGVAALIKAKFGKLNFRQIKKAIVTGTTKYPHLASGSKSGGLLSVSGAVSQAKNLNTVPSGLAQGKVNLKRKIANN